VPKAVHILDSSSPASLPDRPPLRDCLLSLTANLVPREAFAQNAAEALYLAPFADLNGERSPAALSTDIHAALSTPVPADAGLLDLCSAQDLSRLETLAIAICHEVERDPMMGRCMAYLQHPIGGSRPTLSLLNAMLSPIQSVGEDPIMFAIAGSRAVELGLLQLVNDTAPLPEQAVKIPSALSQYFATGKVVWPGTRTGLPQATFELPASIHAAAQAHARSLSAMPGGTLVLRCSSREESAVAAQTIAAFCNAGALFVEDIEKALPAIGPVCRSKHLIPVLGYTCGPGDMIRLPEIKGYDGTVLVMAGLEGIFETNHGHLTSWIIPRPTREERRRLWASCLGEDRLAQRLAENHVHSTSRIVALATLARSACIQTRKGHVGLEEIRAAAWQSQGTGLSSLAEPVGAKVNDEALIVRPFTRRQLDLLEKRCRFRERLADHLGVTMQTRYQMGVKSLFLGPSGTGKTLAACWLATRLGIPLYRVDLAAITSKYIGETEKNLAQLLGQAEQEEVVLLFDEADAIFGKRTEIKDANDRFANAQTNYLLQRIETFSGVVVLTSNSKARFDPAFTRRLDMMIEFPLPSPEERRAIWLSHIGTFHDLSKANINQLAVQCNLAGGHIRSVVLAAAAMAENGRRKISFQDVISGLFDEYHKLGKQMPSELQKSVRTQS